MTKAALPKFDLTKFVVEENLSQIIKTRKVLADESICSELDNVRFKV